MVQHARAPEPVDRLRPLAVALAAIVVVGAVAVALGAPVVLAGLPVVAALGLAVLCVRTVGRARDAERLARHLDERSAALETQLRIELEARESAEARLAWRSRLGSLRRTTGGDVLIDPETGLLLECWLVTAVESRIAAGRRKLTPVAVVMLEVVEGLDDLEPAPFDPRQASELLKASLREADGTFRLDDGSFAVLLEDTDDSGALVVARRFGDIVESMAPGAVVRAGVACYPAHGMEGRELLDRADRALDEARLWRQHRVEVAPTES